MVIALGWLLFAERLSIWQLAGTFVILGSGLWQIQQQRVMSSLDLRTAERD